MTFTINSDNPRSIKAIEIAADAGQWLRCRTADGEVAFGIQSSKGNGLYYVVTQTSCTCPDFRRNGLSDSHVGRAGDHFPCKHMLAVLLHVELVDAMQDRTPGGRRRHLHLMPARAAAELADQYGSTRNPHTTYRDGDIFKRFQED